MFLKFHPKGQSSIFTNHSNSELSLLCKTVTDFNEIISQKRNEKYLSGTESFVDEDSRLKGLESFRTFSKTQNRFLEQESQKSHQVFIVEKQRFFDSSKESLKKFKGIYVIKD